MQRLPASLRSRRGQQSRSARALAERRQADDRIRLSESVGHDKGRPRDRSQCWLEMIPASNQLLRTEIQIVIRLRIRACAAEPMARQLRTGNCRPEARIRDYCRPLPRLEPCCSRTRLARQVCMTVLFLALVADAP